MSAFGIGTPISRVLKQHGDKYGCHVIEGEARGTTTECFDCGVPLEKSLWVREYSCPSCGFEGNRDRNAAFNAQQRGWDRLGVVHSEETPAETAASGVRGLCLHVASPKQEAPCRKASAPTDE